MKGGQSVRQRRQNSNDNHTSDQTRQRWKHRRKQRTSQWKDVCPITVYGLAAFIILIFCYSFHMRGGTMSKAVSNTLAAVHDISKVERTYLDKNSERKMMRGVSSNARKNVNEHDDVANIRKEKEKSFDMEPFVDELQQKLDTPKRHIKKQSDAKNDIENEITLTNKQNEHKHTIVHCGDNKTGILNDDYCDCENGFDEPDTSACSHILVQQKLFQCHDGEKKIFTSRVGDGVKDCIDGSDEVDDAFEIQENLKNDIKLGKISDM